MPYAHPVALDDGGNLNPLHSGSPASQAAEDKQYKGGEPAGLS